MSSPSIATNLNPKYCVYGCNTKIYWNTIVSEYWEISTNKKHLCPNRSKNNSKPGQTTAVPVNNDATPMPTHYNNNHKNSGYNSNYNYKKPWTPKLNSKQPMDNSLE